MEKSQQVEINNKPCPPKKLNLHPQNSIPLLHDIIKSLPKKAKALWPRLCPHTAACHSSTHPPAMMNNHPNTHCELLLGVWQTPSNFPPPPQHTSSIQSRGHFQTAHTYASSPPSRCAPTLYPATEAPFSQCSRKAEKVDYSLLNLST